MIMSKILFLLAGGVFVFYWWRSQQIKDKAYQAVLTHCYKADLELLDGNIALAKQGFERDKNGKLHWLRYFQFEFTSTREHRYKGTVVMAGFHLVDISLEPYHIN